MAHSIQGGVNFDNMAAKMLGEVNIPNNYTSDTTFQSVQDLGRALIDQAATARTLTNGGTMNITNYKGNGADAISVVEADATEIPINGDVGGVVQFYDENGNVCELRWNVTYVDKPHVG